MIPLNKKKIKQVIIDWFMELEKKQSVAQTREIEEKGLWCADLKSISFEKMADGIADALFSKMIQGARKAISREK